MDIKNCLFPVRTGEGKISLVFYRMFPVTSIYFCIMYKLNH